MRTAIIGYPRVGTLRELKFATEKYFKKRALLMLLEILQKRLERANG